MPPITPTQSAHIDVALTNLSLRYSNAEFLSEQIAQRVPVGKQSDKYWIYGRENLQLPASDLRAPASAAQRVTRSKSTDNYFCDDHSLEELIANEERGNSDLEDPINESVELLTDKIMLQKEKSFMAMVTNTAIVTQNVTKTTTAKWSDASRVKFPINDILEYHGVIAKNSGKRANTLLMGFEVWQFLKTDPTITARVSPSRVGPVTTEDLRSIFEVERVLVSAAVERSAAGVNSFLLGKHVVLAYVGPSAGQKTLDFAKTFVWTGAPGSSGGRIVTTAPATPVSTNAVEVAVHEYYDQKVTCVECAYLVKDAI